MTVSKNGAVVGRAGVGTGPYMGDLFRPFGAPIEEDTLPPAMMLI